MESMTMFYPPEDQGKVCVTASYEEWATLREELFDNMQGTLTEDTVAWQLLVALFEQGVNSE